MPCAHSKVSMRLATPSQITLGACMWASLAITSPSSLAAAASSLRSSSRASERATAVAAARGSSRRRGTAKRSARRAPSSMAPMSAATRCSMPGLSTFTATRRPSWSTAGWAWASEAAATGGSKLVNRVSSGRSRPASTSARARSRAKGGRRSLRRPRSSANSVPKMSARVERSWPSLIAAGPSASNARPSRSPGRPRARAPPARVRRMAAGARSGAGARCAASRGSRAS